MMKPFVVYNHQLKIIGVQRNPFETTIDDANQRLQTIDNERSSVKKQLQQCQTDSHQHVMTITQLKKEVTDCNDVIGQLTASCRLVYRAYQPLRERAQDLAWQKIFLNQQNQKLHVYMHPIIAIPPLHHSC
jgi:chromosome segregation ATPase